MSFARSPKRRCRSAFMAINAPHPARRWGHWKFRRRVPQQAPCIVRATGVEIGLEQRERHEIVLRTTAANSFTFAGERFERVDRGGEVSLLEGDETARQGGQVRTGGVASFARQLPPSAGRARSSPPSSAATACARMTCRSASPLPGLRQRAARVVMHRAPGRRVARMPGEFGPPQERRGVRTFSVAARRYAGRAKASRKSRNASAALQASSSPSARCQLRWP